MEKVVDELQKFNLSKIEATVYLTLVRYSGLNGSQISKLLNANRGSVYSALNSLYDKGAVYLMPGEKKVYKAKKPEIFIENLKNKYIEDYKNSAEVLKDEFSKFESVKTQEQEYWNIKGQNNFILKAKELLFSAQEEIYINTNYNLRAFSEEFKELNSRGVKIIMFSPEKIETEFKFIELYSLGQEPDVINKKMMLVVDDSVALIMSGKATGEFIGTFTSNKYLVEIVSEHIHYDIYMLKIGQKFGSSLFKDIKLKTHHEENFINKIIDGVKNAEKNKKKLKLKK
ncbi:TrmB family transcriptional regulator [Haliovirga abyssi]|uniref:TrmB family transcriptional regulator n=1 Tax=Haliovirga abyssi TaxID=2996794 RepID=A0AAU9DCJ3_9FUSO|nr:TrmB family transcriptional regulator [Haliovirga abyssi]BDU49868.1 hypothetical protein HLVA_04370 [Haliovirga abyssi]